MHPQPRRGLTLLEMILVLAVIVAVAAMVLPAMQGPMNDQRLRKAGELVMAQWSQARLQAIKTGQIQMFQYEPGTDLFQVLAWSSGGEEGMGDPAGQAAATMMPPAGGPLRDAPMGVRGQRLPSGVTFFFGETEMSTRLALSGAAASSAGNSAAPIVFYPDGSATNARLILTNERFCVELQLRGLTGLARSSELLAVEEIQQ